MADVTCTIDGMEFLQSLARQVVPDTYDALEDVLRRERNRLIGETPRGDGKPHGHLADKWTYDITVTPQGVEGAVRNTQPYAGNAREPWPRNRRYVDKLLLNKRRVRVITAAILDRAGDELMGRVARG